MRVKSLSVRILIIEDHTGIQIALKMLLELEGFVAETVGSGEEALVLYAAQDFDVILLDLATNGMTALEFMTALRANRAQKCKAMPRVGVMSGSTKIETEAKMLGTDFTIRKPFDHVDLLAQLNLFDFSRDLPRQPDISDASAG